MQNKMGLVSAAASGMGRAGALRFAAVGVADKDADAAPFLLSDEASFITGAALPVDGGYGA